MDNNPPKIRFKKSAKNTEAQVREERLKRALRENLHRRKAQGRARDTEITPVKDQDEGQS
ncbi:MAG: hypothetical protein QNL16_06950 [Rhodobacterales bacterium]|jgi:hypothetical protein|nr:hypothetical protein [Pseudomonadota bacterium]MDA1286394.1 hypothetical protein [Pseudomonadota bacterium]NQW13306.1 hypothetical protein [Rhodobacter sp.]